MEFDSSIVERKISALQNMQRQMGIAKECNIERWAILINELLDTWASSNTNILLVVFSTFLTGNACQMCLRRQFLAWLHDYFEDIKELAITVNDNDSWFMVSLSPQVMMKNGIIPEKTEQNRSRN